jgi:hypothetical protein
MKHKQQRKLSVKAAKKVRFQVKNALISRSKIRNHKPTMAQVHFWFNTLNKGIFNNRLVAPGFVLKRLKGCWGQCFCLWDGRAVKCPKDHLPVGQTHPSIKFVIELKTNYNTWKDFIETLAHEMVHLYQMTIDLDPLSNHNANFYKWKNKFKTFHLGLSL